MNCNILLLSAQFVFVRYIAVHHLPTYYLTWSFQNSTQSTVVCVQSFFIRTCITFYIELFEGKMIFFLAWYSITISCFLNDSNRYFWKRYLVVLDVDYCYFFYFLSATLSVKFSTLLLSYQLSVIGSYSII